MRIQRAISRVDEFLLRDFGALSFRFERLNKCEDPVIFTAQKQLWAFLCSLTALFSRVSFPQDSVVTGQCLRLSPGELHTELVCINPESLGTIWSAEAELRLTSVKTVCSSFWMSPEGTSDPASWSLDEFSDTSASVAPKHFLKSVGRATAQRSQQSTGQTARPDKPIHRRNNNAGKQIRLTQRYVSQTVPFVVVRTTGRLVSTGFRSH